MTPSTNDREANVVLRALEFRRDRGEWIVGTQGGEQIVALPEIGMAAVRLLAAGHTVEETRRSLRADTGRDVDVRAFAERLAAAGLVASIGDRRFAAEAPAVSFPRLRPHHVRWIMSPVLQGFVLLVPVVALLTALSRPWALPAWGELLWTEYGTFTVLVQSTVAVCLIALHEMAHLMTARAAGVSGRIRLGTRLQFLVAQTEVSGIWLKSRRERLTVYLSGLALDGVIWSGCVMARCFGVNWVLIPVVAMTLVTALANQCLVFMRTDLYFVIQDLTGCRNLYADAGHYLRHVAARLFRRHPKHPLRVLPAAERRFLKAYALGTVMGTVICVFIGFRILIDVTWPLFHRSLANLVDGADPWIQVDALATAVILAGLQVLWARLWWNRHADRVRRVVHSIRTRLCGG
ncbi:hypothetical protein F7R91_11270 [Streptomyces luteolifulvus]|uniref:Peptidase M50 n=1 Tax=Streptomyces luteolifulvus TaxID=2615112 RepID=A0A6H9V479_9ACTN|nr:hypothetical protein [Streptomyces luteolifulvus]KAB1147666.1 hypothetical protein F7R91_11270 [Streptomyces luteolifulvus]